MKTIEKISQEIIKLKAERTKLLSQEGVLPIDRISDLLFYYDGELDVLEWVLDDDDDDISE
jgi:hypothetical protein